MKLDEDLITAIGNVNREFQVGVLEGVRDGIGEAGKKQEKKFAELHNRLDIVETAVNRGDLVGHSIAGPRSLNVDPHALAAFQNRTGHDVNGEGLREYDNAFDEMIRRGSAASLDAKNTLQVGSDPDGGYLVTPERSARIVAKMYETSPMRRLANVDTISSDALEGIIDNDEAGAGWVSEMGARDETDNPQLGQWRIALDEVYAMPVATQKLLDTSGFNVAAWLEQKIAQKLARVENAAFISGNGSGKPRGLLDYEMSTDDDDTRPWGTLQYFITGNNTGFAASDPGDILIDIQQSLNPDYRANAAWVMNRATAGLIRKFKDADGNYLWERSTQAGQPDRLLGSPVVYFEDMADPAANASILAYGDFREAYQIIDHTVGLRLLRDPFTTKGRVKFYAYKRVGGGLLNSEAVRILRSAA